jgi:Phosphotransferase enzyme family
VAGTESVSSTPAGRGLVRTAASQARKAAAQIGLATEQMRPVRVHSNGVFLLPRERLIVRVGGGADAAGRAARSVEVARWLAGCGLPMVEPADVVQPVLIANDEAGDGGIEGGGTEVAAVTFWRQLDIQPGPATAAELGMLLRRLHALPPPPFALPAFRPLDRLVAAARTSSWLAAGDREWLVARAAQLRERLAAASSVLGPAGLVHGDAQLDNALRAVGRGVVLADWDSVAYAPRKWDLIPMMVEERFGGPPELLEELVAAYGVDIARGEQWELLRDIYELRSVAAHIRRAGLSPPHAEEARRRIASLRSGDRRVRWYPVG